MDWVVPLPKPLREVGCAKQFRSSWLTVSQSTLRDRGLGAQYEAALEPRYRDAILSAVPGMWLPMDVALAHYRACDGLGMTDVELLEMGRLTMWRAHGTAISFLGRLAHGVGATPWTVIAGAPRIWSHTVDDGAFAAARLGPKDARIDFVGFPLAAIRYNRVTMRGIVHGAVELFCQNVYVREITSLCDDRNLALRLSWV